MFGYNSYLIGLGLNTQIEETPLFQHISKYLNGICQVVEYIRERGRKGGRELESALWISKNTVRRDDIILARI